MPRASALSARAYDRLRRAIVDGDVRPGAALVETQVAEQLGMSRTPVREALKVLARDGLLDVAPARGYFVPQRSIDDLRELFEIREALEGMAARHAASRATDAEIKALDALCRRYERGRGLDNWNRTGTEFHAAIVAASRNARLAAVLDGLKAQIVLTRHSALKSVSSRRAETIDEHRAILHAIERREADDAERQARRHVRLSYRAILQGLQPIDAVDIGADARHGSQELPDAS